MRTQFGNNLRTLREQKGYSQRKLAELIKANQSTINDYETNGKYPQNELRQRLLKVLECTESDLFGYSDGAYSKYAIDKHYKEAIKISSKFKKEELKNRMKLAELEDDGREYMLALIELQELEHENSEIEKRPLVKESYSYRVFDTETNKVIDSKVSLAISKKYPDGELYKMKDEGMNRFIIKNSDIYIIKENNSKKYDNHICLLSIDGYKRIVRRVSFLPVDDLIAVIPQSYDNKYQTITINPKQNENFKILGRVVWTSYQGKDL